MTSRKRTLVFSLAGLHTDLFARTVPAFERSCEEVWRHGIDEVVCIAVNDAFVSADGRFRPFGSPSTGRSIAGDPALLPTGRSE